MQMCLSEPWAFLCLLAQLSEWNPVGKGGKNIFYTVQIDGSHDFTAELQSRLSASSTHKLQYLFFFSEIQEKWNIHWWIMLSIIHLSQRRVTKKDSPILPTCIILFYSYMSSLSSSKISRGSSFLRRQLSAASAMTLLAACHRSHMPKACSCAWEVTLPASCVICIMHCHMIQTHIVTESHSVIEHSC